MAAQQGIAEIASFLPLLEQKVKERLPLARRIVIVTDKDGINRACGRFEYKERKSYKSASANRIIEGYFDGADYDKKAKWKVWILNLA